MYRIMCSILVDLNALVMTLMYRKTRIEFRWHPTYKLKCVGYMNCCNKYIKFNSTKFLR